MNLEMNKNEDAQKMAWSFIRQKLEIIAEGGGNKAIAKQKEKNNTGAAATIQSSQIDYSDGRSYDPAAVRMITQDWIGYHMNERCYYYILILLNLIKISFK